MHTFYIETYGCQMNGYDSDRIVDILLTHGMKKLDEPNDAEVIILNTCHIREKAAEKVYSRLGRLRKMKTQQLEQKSAIFIVTGCVAQAEGEEMIKRAPFIDIVMGPESYHKILDAIDNIRQKNMQNIYLDFVPDEKFDHLATIGRNVSGKSCTVTVQEGCDRFCTFCVVPYTRGPSFFRNVDQIIDEVQSLVDGGVIEIQLLGQNVNAFESQDNVGRTWKLSQLIARLTMINGLERLSYITSHPLNMSDDLIAIHGAEKKLIPILNLPVQSGSNKILKLMNRQYTHEKYEIIIEKLRKARSDIIIGSDFIVGFPSESDQDFQDTLDLVKKIQFHAMSFSFKYSPRHGTPASLMDQIPEEIKSERLSILQQTLEEQHMAFNADFVGKTTHVILDNKNARRSNQYTGRTEYGQIAIFESDDVDFKKMMSNNLIKANVVKFNNNSLLCKPIYEI